MRRCRGLMVRKEGWRDAGAGPHAAFLESACSLGSGRLPELKGLITEGLTAGAQTHWRKESGFGGRAAMLRRTTTRNSLWQPWWQLDLRPQLRHRATDAAVWIALLAQVALPLPLASVFLLDHSLHFHLLTSVRTDLWGLLTWINWEGLASGRWSRIRNEKRPEPTGSRLIWQEACFSNLNVESGQPGPEELLPP